MVVVGGDEGATQIAASAFEVRAGGVEAGPIRVRVQFESGERVAVFGDEVEVVVESCADQPGPGALEAAGVPGVEQFAEGCHGSAEVDPHGE